MKYRKKDDGTFQGTTWQIKFKLDNVVRSGTYTLRLALASANAAELQVYNFITKSRSSLLFQFTLNFMRYNSASITLSLV